MNSPVIEITEPQCEFIMSDHPHPAFFGGLGCVHPETKVYTENGLMRICDITSPIRVLSWNEKSQQFQLSLSGGSFPKGRANLFRVLTRLGEFLSSGHHQIFSSDCKYVRVDSIEDHDDIYQVVPSQLQAILEQSLKSSILNGQHYCKINEDFLESYAILARQHGQQLLTEEENDLYFSQEFQQFHEKFFPRHTAHESLARDQSHNIFSLSNSLVKENIISCVDLGAESIYYDMQVLETNNYVCENGFIHHNSGKSEALIIRLVSLMEQDKGTSVAHYFPSYKLAKRRGLSGVQKYLKRRGIKYCVNKSELTVTIPEFNDGIYYLDTYHDPDSIVSYEIAHAGVDELDTLSFENAEYAWRKITERVRETTRLPQGNTLAVASTTDHGKAGFCYSVWRSGENIDKGYHYIKGGTSTNPFLPKGYVEQISKNYDPLMLEAMVNGGWVNFTANKIYHFYDRKRHATAKTLLDSDHLHIGLDFNVGGTCATCFVIDGDKAHAVHEFVSHDTQDFINRLARFNNVEITVYPDASGNSNRTNASESDIMMIRRAGYTVKHKATNPAVRDRINAVNGMLSHDRLLVNADKCPELATALESQGYTDKGEPEKFTHHPAMDDRVDGLGYFIAFMFPIRIERPELERPKQTYNPHAHSWQA